MPMMPTSLLSAIEDALGRPNQVRLVIGEFRHLFDENTINSGANVTNAPEGSLHD
jgi:hypothetical protein